MVPETVSAIITGAGLLLGLFLKNKTELNNKWIPIALAVIMMVKNLIAQLTNTPELAPMLGLLDTYLPAVTGGAYHVASFWSGLLPIVSIIIPSVVEAVIPVGWHSFLKNTFQGIGVRELKKARSASAKK